MGATLWAPPSMLADNASALQPGLLIIARFWGVAAFLGDCWQSDVKTSIFASWHKEQPAAKLCLNLFQCRRYLYIGRFSTDITSVFTAFDANIWILLGGTLPRRGLIIGKCEIQLCVVEDDDDDDYGDTDDVDECRSSWWGGIRKWSVNDAPLSSHSYTEQ